MKTPPQIIWEASGSPKVPDCAVASGRCFVCVGDMIRGMPVSDWMGTNFTDQNRARAPAATHVCEACCYVHSRTAPVPGRPAKEGKKFGGNFRNYSHLWDERGYANASKGEKPLIREFLSRKHPGPWFAALADSGQKHVLPFAPMNGRGRSGVVLFDEMRIPVPDDQSLVDECAALLTAGATKEELTSGYHSPRAWQLCGSELEAFERAHGLRRGGPWFTLAIWLAQRDEEQVAARQAAEKEAKNAGRKGKGKTANADSRVTARDSSGVPRKSRSKCAKALGSTTGENEGSGADNIKPRGVGDESATRTEPVGAKQLSIF